MNSWERDWFAIELFKRADSWDNDDLRDKDGGTKARLKEYILDNDDLLADKLIRSNVYDAVDSGKLEAAIGILAKFVRKSVRQEETIKKQAEEIRYLEDNIRQLEMKSCQSQSVPPAERRDLDIKEMYARYKELGSFSAVGRLMGCSHKTVKNRLKKAGLI